MSGERQRASRTLVIVKGAESVKLGTVGRVPAVLSPVGPLKRVYVDEQLLGLVEATSVKLPTAPINALDAGVAHDAFCGLFGGARLSDGLPPLDEGEEGNEALRRVGQGVIRDLTSVRDGVSPEFARCTGLPGVRPEEPA